MDASKFGFTQKRVYDAAQSSDVVEAVNIGEVVSPSSSDVKVSPEIEVVAAPEVNLCKIDESDCEACQ